MGSQRHANWLAFVAGGVHWAVCSAIVGGEAWDGAVYYMTLPLLAACCGVLGALERRHPWRLGGSAAVAQAIGLVLTAGAGASMLPVGLALLGGLGLGLGACGWVGGRLAGTFGLNHG